MLSENLPSPCDLCAMKVPRPATPIATSALPPTSHGDLRHGGEGNKRDRSGVAGPSCVGRSHSTGQPLKALIVLFLVFFPCCTEAAAWKWGAEGASCTAACASEGQTCVQSELEKVNNQANFNAVKGPGVVCDYYEGNSYDYLPGRKDWSDGYTECYPQSGTGGTCTAYSVLHSRVCPCSCPTNTISPPFQTWPCPR